MVRVTQVPARHEASLHIRPCDFLYVRDDLQKRDVPYQSNRVRLSRTVTLTEFAENEGRSNEVIGRGFLFPPLPHACPACDHRRFVTDIMVEAGNRSLYVNRALHSKV